MERLTKRYIIKSLDSLPLNQAIHYERYYINDNLRIQKKKDKYEKEILDKNNVLISKIIIDEKEFNELKKQAYKEIIRDSYLYLNDLRVSIKKYYGDYEGLIRVEVSFETEEEMNNYKKEKWMGSEITNTPLAFDKDLSKINKEEFEKVLTLKEI